MNRVPRLLLCVIVCVAVAVAPGFPRRTLRASLHLDAKGHADGSPARQKPRAFVHIGPRKTGSSYIQAKLCDEEEELARANVIIPITPACRPKVCYPEHFSRLAYQLINEGADAHEWHDTSKWRKRSATCNPLHDLVTALKAANGSDVIISSEIFDRLGDDSVATLADILLPHFDVHVIYVLRNKARHLLSFYTERAKRMTPPLTFQEFYWLYASDTDVRAWPGAQQSVSEGLFLSHVVHTFGKHFGMDKFIIINFDAVGNKLWDVFTEAILGRPLSAKHSGTSAVAAKSGTARSPAVQRVNVSPDAFALTTAAHYYAARWGVHGYQHPIFLRMGPQQDPQGVPNIKCVLPHLENVADVLPKLCTSMANIVGPWEREERATLDRLAASGSELILFDAPADNRSSSLTKACDVDFEAVMRLANKTSRAEGLLWALRDVSQKIDEACVM